MQDVKSLSVTDYGVTNSSTNNILNLVVPHSGRNVALGQNATQYPGTFGKHVASNAVDGNRDTSVDYGGACAHTDPQHGPAWWSVRFDRPYRISGIEIFSRSNPERRFRLKNFTVMTYNKDILLYDDSAHNQWTQRVIKIPIDDFQDKYFESVNISVPVNKNTSVDNGNSMITLCEVEVYTYPLCTVPDVRNGRYVVKSDNHLQEKSTLGANKADDSSDYYGSGYVDYEAENLQSDYKSGMASRDYGAEIISDAYQDDIKSGLQQTNATSGAQADTAAISATLDQDDVTPGIQLETGAAVKLICDTGYQPYPEDFEQMRTCQLDGTWSSEDVVCIPAKDLSKVDKTMHTDGICTRTEDTCTPTVVALASVFVGTLLGILIVAMAIRVRKGKQKVHRRRNAESAPSLTQNSQATANTRQHIIYTDLVRATRTNDVELYDQPNTNSSGGCKSLEPGARRNAPDTYHHVAGSPLREDGYIGMEQGTRSSNLDIYDHATEAIPNDEEYTDLEQGARDRYLQIYDQLTGEDGR